MDVGAEGQAPRHQEAGKGAGVNMGSEMAL